MTFWTSLLCVIGCLGCDGSSLPVHHVSPPIAASSDCPPLLVTVDGQPWTGVADQTATLHRTLQPQAGYYEEALEVSVSVAPQPQPDFYRFRVDVSFDPRRSSADFSRTSGFVVDLGGPATLLPGSKLDRGGTVHVCIAPGSGVIGIDSTEPSMTGTRVEVSGRIDAVIEAIAVHDGTTK